MNRWVAILVMTCASCGGLLEPEPSSTSATGDSGLPGPPDARASADATFDASRADDAPPGSMEGAATTDDGSDDAFSEDDQTIDAPTSDGGLPSTAPCLTGGNVLSVEGDPGCFWFTGTQTDGPSSKWNSQAEALHATYDGELLGVIPPQNVSSEGPGWFINFNTWKTQQAMQTGIVYDVATVNDSTEMLGYTRTCSVPLGSFRVDDFVATGGESGIGTLVSFTAAFAVTCQGSPGVLRGCVHYEE